MNTGIAHVTPTVRSRGFFFPLLVTFTSMSDSEVRREGLGTVQSLQPRPSLEY